ncbi:MFS transporter [Mumia flava]|uniref:MFS transporter n=1 Tax=Mumia flava TaxID=1348852 RepID=A0A0B2B8B5_9ACTN|nr:MFS transporter [Mumia flava]PJJ55939.1 MFS transporter [Mumia flava]
MTVEAPARPDRAARTLLTLAAVAVAFAAADTYVVVLALPDMMTSAGIGLDELQRAAPIVSGFLLGYVAVLPLIGRIADLRGRTPVLLGSLVIFAFGSVVTAASYDLGWMVAGRFLQGLGGGGLVPATLALVADLWPPHRRGVPLGVVGAVQEIGAVVGPLYGAVVLAVGDWRAIFWLNCAVGLVLAAALLAIRGGSRDGADDSSDGPARTGLPDVVGGLLAVLTTASLALVLAEPAAIANDVEMGRIFLPVVGESRWTSPAALVVYGLALAFVVRELTARRPLVALRTWPATARDVDLGGALLLGAALGCVIVSFASADPEQAAVSEAAVVLLPAAGVLLVGFVWRQRRARRPLVPGSAVGPRPAWGALLTSFLVGAALIAALVDIPFFARLTDPGSSQLEAALVLLRFLVAVPVGAVVGGWALRFRGPALVTAVGMAAASASFFVMASWEAGALDRLGATVVLVVAGLGFGLALAPVNAALLDATPTEVHGVASALVVVARMVGMLVGISVLTTLGLRAYYDAAAKIPSVDALCGEGAKVCDAYNDALIDAGVAQLSAVFTGAAVCAALAAVAAASLLRSGRTVSSADL